MPSQAAAGRNRSCTVQFSIAGVPKSPLCFFNENFIARKSTVQFWVSMNGVIWANEGHDTRAIQDWLGHRAIQHTARYTELSQERFKDFWRP